MGSDLSQPGKTAVPCAPGFSAPGNGGIGAYRTTDLGGQLPFVGEGMVDGPQKVVQDTDALDTAAVPGHATARKRLGLVVEVVRAGGGPYVAARTRNSSIAAHSGVRPLFATAAPAFKGPLIGRKLPSAFARAALVDVAVRITATPDRRGGSLMVMRNMVSYVRMFGTLPDDEVDCCSQSSNVRSSPAPICSCCRNSSLPARNRPPASHRHFRSPHALRRHERCNDLLRNRRKRSDGAVCTRRGWERRELVAAGAGIFEDVQRDYVRPPRLRSFTVYARTFHPSHFESDAIAVLDAAACRRRTWCVSRWVGGQGFGSQHCIPSVSRSSCWPTRRVRSSRTRC